MTILTITTFLSKEDVERIKRKEFDKKIASFLGNVGDAVKVWVYNYTKCEVETINAIIVSMAFGTRNIQLNLGYEVLGPEGKDPVYVVMPWIDGQQTKITVGDCELCPFEKEELVKLKEFAIANGYFTEKVSHLKIIR